MMRIVQMLAALVILASNAWAETVTIQGRESVLFSPKALGDRPAPLVIALHGALGNGTQLRWALGLDAEAQARGFRVLYMFGTDAQVGYAPFGRVWNSGVCCGVARRQDVDDVAYLKAVVIEMKRRRIASSVFAVGHSNGGMMSLRLACAEPDLLDGVIAIAGVLLSNRCKRLSGLPVMHIHGLRDAIVPVAGRLNDADQQVRFPPLDQSVRVLRAAGADVEVVRLKAGRHLLGSIDRAMRRQFGQGLPEHIARVIADWE